MQQIPTIDLFKRPLSIVCLLASGFFAGCGGDDPPPSSVVTPPTNTPIQVKPINFGSATFGSVVDVEGNTYKTITVATVTWMAENLRTTKFRNGDAIPKINGGAPWTGASSAALYAYGDYAELIAVYGRLYNGYAMKDERGICPSGWHVPTPANWEALATALGGIGVAGDKMKEQGTDHWITTNASDNQSGFTGLPGGSVHNGQLADLGTDGYWWSTADGVFFYLTNNEMNLRTKGTSPIVEGLAIRCVKD